jgi:hypothetical protein
MSFAMLLTGAVVFALLVPYQQRAVAKGVFFDPDSPAGKEYALPLDQARDEAAGVHQSDGPAGKKAPLFGEGVSGRGSGPRQGASGGGAGGGSGADHAEAPAGSGARGQGQGLPAAAVTAAAISSTDDDYALSSAILWVAAIVVLGGIAGLALRAAQRPRPT